MALRINTCVHLLYRGLWSGRRFGAADRLPPVLPVVLYNGGSPWTAATSVEELVAPEERPAGSAKPVPVYAGSGYVMLDVGRVPGGSSPPDDVVSLVIGIEGMSSLEEGYATLLEAFSVLRGSEHRSLRRVFHEWFSLLAGQGAGGAVIEGFEEMERLEEAGELRTPVKVRAWARARARAWQEAERAQGRAEGVEQGRAEGVERERALLRRLTERKFGAETADRLSAFLAGIGEPERLADIGDWIIDCASGDELVELRTPVQDRVRAWREAERAQGRAEGVEQGRAEGVDQERALLRRLTERKFGAETADRLSAFLAGIGEPERLADIGDWIIDCASGDELIARVESAA